MVSTEDSTKPDSGHMKRRTRSTQPAPPVPPVLASPPAPKENVRTRSKKKESSKVTDVMPPCTSEVNVKESAPTATAEPKVVFLI